MKDIMISVIAVVSVNHVIMMKITILRRVNNLKWTKRVSKFKLQRCYKCGGWETPKTKLGSKKTMLDLFVGYGACECHMMLIEKLMWILFLDDLFEIKY